MFANQRSDRSSRIRPAVLALLVLAAALSRLLPHPPNFTPIGAMALFGGAYFGSRAAAVAVPLAAMLLSDVVLSVTMGWGFGGMTLVIYACIAASVWLGRGMRNDWSGGGQIESLASCSLLSASLFFLVTNFAVWAGSSTYPQTGSGLLACYTAAIPFFGNSLAGFAVYGTCLFGGFALLQRRFEALAPPLTLDT